MSDHPQPGASRHAGNRPLGTGDGDGLTASDITLAYRLFYDRDPETPQVVAGHLARHPHWRSFRAAILASKEFQDKFPASVTAQAARGSKPLNGPPIRVDVEVAPAQLAEMLRLVEGNWEALGRSEPHWSVLTNSQFKADNIRNSEAAFYQSGKSSLELMTAAAARCGVDLAPLRSCVELGCGVGRVSIWLARQFASLTAVDISRPHLDLAEDAARQRGIANIGFVQIRSPQALGELPPFDALYSVIVLQHNPPPVMRSILDALLPKLNPGGIAYFQVPTYRFGYSFDAAAYLASAAIRGQMELHVLPQPALFSLFARHGCEVLEVREDNWTGSPHVISNSFLVRKRSAGTVVDMKPKQSAAAAPAGIPDFLDKVRWHHSIELPDGRVIKGDKSLAVMKQQYDMTFGPLDLKGKSVLDLGTWSGAFAVEAARRGAAKVTAVDYVTWRPPFPHGREAFDFVVASSGFDIEGIELDLDASPLSLARLGTFDVVLLLGVFYHLKDPIAPLKEISKIAREAFVLETYFADKLPPQPPAMVFYPGRELNNDAGNWWGPNVACVDALLRTFGFRQVVATDGSAYNRKVFHAYKAAAPRP